MDGNENNGGNDDLMDDWWGVGRLDEQGFRDG